MKTVCLVYGFAEGPRVSAKMRRELTERGYGLVKDPGKADVIVAHSGGCFMLPPEHKARLVLLIDPPMWTGRGPLRGLPAKVRQETKDEYWYRKTALNVWYFTRRPLKWMKMGGHIRNGALNTRNARVMMIRNQEDSFTNPSDALTCVSDNGWSICSVAGGHDDLWSNPKRYVDVLQGLDDKH